LKQLNSKLEGLDSIAIYGPEVIPLIFNKELEANYLELHRKVVEFV